VACLDENDFAAYFDLRMAPAETARLFQHVDECAACAGLFSAAAAARARPDDPSERTAPDAGGRPAGASPTLGRYRVERILGMGGMGVVYAAYDPELNRKVAIKLLQPDSQVTAGTLRSRLMREAQAMAQLSHPNVINVFEVGTFGEQVFVVMELIDGTTLGGWLRKEPRSWREIVRVFAAAGAGLAAAHRAGIVHRDFKPDNVLVGKDGRIFVTDFGLARRIEDGPDSTPASVPVSPLDATLTRSGLLVGTPAYMAPEQMRAEATDERTDVFSFCVALYEALHGVRPYTGKNLDELRAAIETHRPKRGRRIPRFLDRALLIGMAPLPAERHRSMEALLEVLADDRRPGRLWSAALVLCAGVVSYLFWHPPAPCPSPLEKVWDAPHRAALQAAFAGKPWLVQSLRAVNTILDERARSWAAMQVDACQATRVRGEQSAELLDRRIQCLDDRRRETAALIEVLSAGAPEALERSLSAVASLEPIDRCRNPAVGPEPPSQPEAQRRLAEVRALTARAEA
jgi:serine/threonine protein kinase